MCIISTIKWPCKAAWKRKFLIEAICVKLWSYKLHQHQATSGYPKWSNLSPQVPPSQLFFNHLHGPRPFLVVSHLEAKHLGENPSCRVISRVNKPRSPVPCNTPARSAGRSSSAPWTRRVTRLAKAPRTGEQSWRWSAWGEKIPTIWGMAEFWGGIYYLRNHPKRKERRGEDVFSHEIHEIQPIFLLAGTC